MHFNVYKNLFYENTNMIYPKLLQQKISLKSSRDDVKEDSTTVEVQKGVFTEAATRCSTKVFLKILQNS